MPPEPRTIDDPRTLRAIAHPVRMRMLDLFDSEPHQRATDIAQALDIPANQASFHLRQLAKYGLVVEAPEAARDGRDRVWRLASPIINIDSRRLAQTAAGRAALDVFRAQWAPQAHALVDRIAGGSHRDGQVVAAIAQSLRLNETDARAFLEELRELTDRWSRRSERPEDAITYDILLAVAPEEAEA